MPFGEAIGSTLPAKAKMPLILIFSFILGMGATFAEPAIPVLRMAGEFVEASTAPILHALLDESAYSDALVLAVGIGVGIALMLGVLRFLYGWSLKVLIIPSVLVLMTLTLIAHFIPEMAPVIGLAWDCGAVTTGPVTVPLVLALGIGVCRIVGTGDSGSAGFGIVTLASLFPVIAVFLLGFGLLLSGDYQMKVAPAVVAKKTEHRESQDSEAPHFTLEELARYESTGHLPEDARMTFKGKAEIDEQGALVISKAKIVVKKTTTKSVDTSKVRLWNHDVDLGHEVTQVVKGAMQAILPLCLFLFVILRFVLREKLRHADEILLGIGFAVVGFAVFYLGISLALTPLGQQVGANLPSAFSTISFDPKDSGLSGSQGPLFGDGIWGKLIVVLFGFAMGYGATLAEPALNALGATVERVTVGAFRKSLLMQTVAIGVGFGIAGGISKLIFGISLLYLLVPPYLLLLVLTWFSNEDFVNFSWDSAGVTTGPITVPLVLGMGLGLGGSVGALEGFGVLAMASVGPILSVLIVGLMVNRARSQVPGDTEETSKPEVSLG
jgi:hypothetical protein